MMPFSVDLTEYKSAHAKRQVIYSAEHIKNLGVTFLQKVYPVINSYADWTDQEKTCEVLKAAEYSLTNALRKNWMDHCGNIIRLVTKPKYSAEVFPFANRDADIMHEVILELARVITRIPSPLNDRLIEELERFRLDAVDENDEDCAANIGAMQTIIQTIKEEPLKAAITPSWMRTSAAGSSRQVEDRPSGVPTKFEWPETPSWMRTSGAGSSRQEEDRPSGAGFSCMGTKGIRAMPAIREEQPPPSFGWPEKMSTGSGKRKFDDRCIDLEKDDGSQALVPSGKKQATDLASLTPEQMEALSANPALGIIRQLLKLPQLEERVEKNEQELEVVKDNQRKTAETLESISQSQVKINENAADTARILQSLMQQSRAPLVPALPPSFVPITNKDLAQYTHLAKGAKTLWVNRYNNANGTISVESLHKSLEKADVAAAKRLTSTKASAGPASAGSGPDLQHLLALADAEELQRLLDAAIAAAKRSAAGKAVAGGGSATLTPTPASGSGAGKAVAGGGSATLTPAAASGSATVTAAAAGGSGAADESSSFIPTNYWLANPQPHPNGNDGTMQRTHHTYLYGKQNQHDEDDEAGWFDPDFFRDGNEYQFIKK